MKPPPQTPQLYLELLPSPALLCLPLLSLVFPPSQQFTCPRQYFYYLENSRHIEEKRPQQRPLGAELRKTVQEMGKDPRYHE